MIIQSVVPAINQWFLLAARRLAHFSGTLLPQPPELPCSPPFDFPPEILWKNPHFQALVYQATHDSLTGLMNRYMLESHAEKAINQEKRQKNNIALLFLDLDNFKHINDSLGHPMGDRALVAVAERLKNNSREGDVLTRFGGDEFILLAMNIGPKDGPSLLERYKRAFSQPFSIDNHTLHLSCSIGIGVYPNDGEDMGALLKHADAEMYAAKYNAQSESERMKSPSLLF
jgi:diguanylate cyclase (GGDEF)-like protein